MEFKTSRKVYGFTAIAVACAGLGIVAQVSLNLSSSQAKTIHNNQLKTVAQHKLSNTCRPLDGGQFQKGELIEEEVGKTPTACYRNNQGEYAFAAYINNRLTITGAYSTEQVNAKISQLKAEEKK